MSPTAQAVAAAIGGAMTASGITYAWFDWKLDQLKARAVIRPKRATPPLAVVYRPRDLNDLRARLAELEPNPTRGEPLDDYGRGWSAADAVDGGPYTDDELLAGWRA